MQKTTNHSDELHNTAILLPEIPMSRYCKLTGLSMHTVQKMVIKKYLPSRKVGKYRMINLQLIAEQARAECRENEFRL